jgi:dihydrofolate synthase / folylpolyglutamate synthase
MSERWSNDRVERHLRSLELFGMRFGLDRMRRMMTALGSPERRFQSIHVVGTNGKSSTTRMTAAILERHGVRTGAYLSPHLVSYCERVQVGERDISPEGFTESVARAVWAAERVNHTLSEDDHVTQFELLTAAAFWALAEHGVQVAVIEAGLGGRYDATSAIESKVTVLTNVGLEHTRWLGPTVRDIAEEKLAVVCPDTTLALGANLDAQAMAVARRVALEQEARIVQVYDEWSHPLLARGRVQRANFALAEVAAAAWLDTAGIELLAEAVRDAALHTFTAGRMHVLDEEPLVVLDGAHNPAAVAALARELPELLNGRSLGLVLGVLEDKDAASILKMLLPMCARAWFTAPPSPRALSPAALESLARQQGFREVTCEPHPERALAAAREWAAEQTGAAKWPAAAVRPRAGEQTAGEAGAGEEPGGAAVLATGSIYLVGALLGEEAEFTRRRAEG